MHCSKRRALELCRRICSPGRERDRKTTAVGHAPGHQLIVDGHIDDPGEHKDEDDPERGQTDQHQDIASHAASIEEVASE